MIDGQRGATIYDKQDRHARRVRLTIDAGDPGSVKEVASQIEPTPSVLPQLFRLDGQSGHLQAEFDEMKDAGLRKNEEGVSECEESRLASV